MDTPPRVAVIVAAAGAGTRLGAGIPKAFVTVAWATLLEHAVQAVAEMTDPVQLIVVAPSERLDEARSLVTAFVEDAIVVVGGPSRQASIAEGLKELVDTVEVVLVHDAARAFTPAWQFDAVVAAVDGTGEGVVPGLPMTDTVKRRGSDSRITETVDRSELVAVQTPQGFPRDILVRAYAAATSNETDDASLVTAIGAPVRIVPGDVLAFKVTTPDDLRRAEQLMRASRDSALAVRVGVGTDTHAYGKVGELWLAGLHWPGESALVGHSDGDAVAHAIVDAVLSAAGLGDIGGAFGASDPRFAGAHGQVFLKAAHDMVTDAGFRIGNVSVQVIGNRPRLEARRAEAEHILTASLGAPVSISATTTDGLGFVGRGEGITAMATALVLQMPTR
jgi:2-C-methyl-D-erythritol 4-phosphate cytidylyltransferase/2-C-methyl-D-erythritol 2,4-cyclodiphosphate synthase